MQNYSLTIRRVFNAPVEKVFQAWANAEELKKWHFPENMSMPSCEVEPKAGGKYRMVMQSEDGQQMVIGGEYEEYVPNKKLVFSWQWENAEIGSEKTLVSVDFKALGEKQTELVLTHEKFASEKTKEDHKLGWESTFMNLQKLAE